MNLTDIEARLSADRDDFGGGWTDQSIRDREALLGMVRELEARIDQVTDLAHWAGKRGWAVDAAAIRVALEPAK